MIYNLGIAGADAYNNDNIATIDSLSATTITWREASNFHSPRPATASMSFLHLTESFHPFTAALASMARQRHWRSASCCELRADASAPGSCPTTPAGTPILATNVTACKFSYEPGVTARSGLISMQIVSSKATRRSICTTKSMSTMRPETARTASARQCLAAGSAGRGFALVSAIFLLVVLAALGAYMMDFSSVQHSTSTQDVNGTRAYQAARAGMEWGVYQILRNPGFVCGADAAGPYVWFAGGFARLWHAFLTRQSRAP